MLRPSRVLDLTDHRGELGPCIVTDLGTDVIRVAPKQGSEARRRGPTVEGVPALDASLQFFASNRNEHPVARDLEDRSDPSHVGDRETFLALVVTADFAFDSAPPACWPRTTCASKTGVRSTRASSRS